jgi:hypothetical protein
MGYTTDFEGSFKFSKPLTVAQYNYLKAFADTRHQKLRIHLGGVSAKEAGVLQQLGLTVGVDGEFYLGEGFDVIDQNVPPSTQPGLWCQWIPSEDGNELHWDGNEKFNKYVEWLEYYIKNFFKRWDIKLNGKVEFWGECEGDHGFIIVKDNVVSVIKTLEETTKTTTTEDLPFNLQNYLGSIDGLTITDIKSSLGGDILVYNKKYPKPQKVGIDTIKNRTIGFARIELRSEYKNNSFNHPGLFVAIQFVESAGDIYLIPIECTIVTSEPLRMLRDFHHP